MVGYKILLEDVLNEYYCIQYGMKYLDKCDIESLEFNLLFECYWQLDGGWYCMVFICYFLENYCQGL